MLFYFGCVWEMTLICRINSQNRIYLPPPLKFAAHSLQRLNVLNGVEIKPYLLRKKLLDEVKRKELDEKNQAILKEGAKRYKVFETYLLPFHGRSSILRDFLTSRF
jgi:hypothetical protein